MQTFKLLIIGESAVGKSCLLSRFTENKFQDAYITTIGVDFKTKYIEIDGTRVQLQIWDTSGSEKYRSITKAYYRGSYGILVVFDLSRRNTFNQTRMWIDSIKDTFTKSIDVVLVGNKCDLERSVTKEEAEDLAAQYKISYFEICAKTNSNVDEVFTYLATEVYQRIFGNAKNASLHNNVKELKEKNQDSKEKNLQIYNDSKNQDSKEKNLQIHNDSENQDSKEENVPLNKDIENQKLKEENSSLRSEVKELKEKNKTYENFLSSLKEKSSELTFFDFDEYKEESVIGEGATSNVKVVSKKEKYAMKELVLFDHKSMQRFLGECEVLFKLRHPCIIRVYGFNYGDELHKPSIILSLEPKSLEAAIKNKELDDEQKNRIVVEIVLGMRYIHKHKFMHRDLKPLNILLSKNNHVRITDFGLVKEDDFEASQSKGVGTLLFMAPELFEENNQRYTNKVDVYSFGIILIFIVTNDYPPFSLKNISIGVLPKLQDNISKWVRELITNCLSPEPENRPTFAEIFEIMKINNFDLFSDSKGKKLSSQQQSMKERIEARVMKIEAFEYQHK